MEVENMKKNVIVQVESQALFEYYGIKLLWELSLDSNQVSSFISNLACEGFLQIYRIEICEPIWEIYLEKCLQNIQNEDSLYVSWYIIKETVRNYTRLLGKTDEGRLVYILNSFNERY